MLGMGRPVPHSCGIFMSNGPNYRPRAESLFRHIRIETLNCIILHLW